MRKILLAAVTTAALLSPAQAQQQSVQVRDMTRADLNQAIRDYLMENPQVLVEAMQVLQAREERQRTEAAKVALEKHRDFLFSNPTSPVAGNKDGDLTIVEFFDYNCGYCKRAAQPLEEVVGSDKNIRVVYKEFPILSESSRTAAKAALAAERQGKYQEMHNALMAHEGALTDDQVLDIAESVGLDMTKLKTDMDSPEIDAALQQIREVAADLNIRGTPAFIIGNEVVPGFIEAPQMRDTVARARAAQKG